MGDDFQSFLIKFNSIVIANSIGIDLLLEYSVMLIPHPKLTLWDSNSFIIIDSC